MAGDAGDGGKGPSLGPKSSSAMRLEAMACWRPRQKRFVVTIDPALLESVTRIVKERGTTYAGRGYATEPDGGRTLHLGNIPLQYGPETNLQKMETVKIPYRQGNVQLTISFLKVDGRAAHLLDCDMDENLNLGKHFFDLIKHLFKRGDAPHRHA